MAIRYTFEADPSVAWGSNPTLLHRLFDIADLDPDAMKNGPPQDDSKKRPASPGPHDADSSLFSVEALKKQAIAVPEEKPKAREESGIINLRSLALLHREKAPEASADSVSASRPAADVFSGNGFGGLIAATPAPAKAAEPAVQPKKSKLLIVGAILLSVAAAAGAFVALRGPTEVAAPIASAAAPPAPVPEKVAQPADTRPAVEAVTPGQLSKKEDPQKPVLGPAKVAGAKTASAATAHPKATAAAVEPPPEEKPAPPVETCDLTCQMQRAVDKKH